MYKTYGNRYLEKILDKMPQTPPFCQVFDVTSKKEGEKFEKKVSDSVKKVDFDPKFGGEIGV